MSIFFVIILFTLYCPVFVNEYYEFCRQGVGRKWIKTKDLGHLQDEDLVIQDE